MHVLITCWFLRPLWLGFTLSVYLRLPITKGELIMREHGFRLLLLGALLVYLTLC